MASNDEAIRQEFNAQYDATMLAIKAFINKEN
jgi:hypothetical protein